MSRFLPVRPRKANSILKGLSISSGTGPDLLAARILKMCAPSLALPISLLARRILEVGAWPKLWKLHWMYTLHKKKSKAKAENYRGIHLTPQLSKVTERLLGSLFLPFLEVSGAYGPNQFAYTSGRSIMDAFALNVMSWILAISRGFRVGLYCSDVAGAFDRVPSERLLSKLRAKGVHPKILKLLEDWLASRCALVIVDGQASKPLTLSNSVFQGTVLGPPLWNVFYEDCNVAIRSQHFKETVLPTIAIATAFLQIPSQT